MNYQEALAYLETLGTFGIQLGLSRITELLARLGHPQRKFRSVHVAGTNGKGSTTAFIAAALSEAGIRTGMYISPHLLDYPERMKIDGEEIIQEEFAAVIDRIREAVEQMKAAGMESPTEFEVLTAAAFEWFSSKQAEMVVVEVGLGGLLDSTNVIVPEIAVITNVSLDHTDRCGNTVEEIAAHKAGIIKQGVPVVTGASGAALAVIERTAAAAGASCLVLDRDFHVDDFGYDSGFQHFTLKIGDHIMEQYHTRLFGRHQADNAALAIRTCRLLGKKDVRLTPQVIAAGVAKASWPGRFEIANESPVVILDGAHNPDGIRTLRRTLDEIYPDRPIVFLFGVLADKDYLGMARTLFRKCDIAVVVRPNSQRAAEAMRVAAEIGDWVAAAEVAGSIGAGLDRARELAGSAGIVCVAGSLYMIGEARQLLFPGFMPA